MEIRSCYRLAKAADGRSHFAVVELVLSRSNLTQDGNQKGLEEGNLDVYWQKAAVLGAESIIKYLGLSEEWQVGTIVMISGHYADTTENTVWVSSAMATLKALAPNKVAQPEFDTGNNAWFVRFEDGSCLKFPKS